MAAVLVFAAVVGGVPAWASKQSFKVDRALRAEINEAVPGLMAKYNVPGVAIAQIAEGEVVWVKGYGYSNTTERVPVTANTVFQVGTISKPVTAWAVMKLVQGGKIDLDLPVSTYLRSWSPPSNHYSGKAISTRGLLSHTAGLNIAEYGGFTIEQETESLDEALSSAVDAGGKGVGPVKPPGEGWLYSSGSYAVLERLIEDLTGKPFAVMLRTRILEPLGMTRSSFKPPEGDYSAQSVSYDRRGRELPNKRYSAKAPQGLLTTPVDMARFVASTMTDTDGQKPGRKVLKKKSVEAMLRPVPNSDNALLLSGSTHGLGYALKKLPISGYTLFYHPGDNSPGWYSLVAGIAEKGSGLVVLTNGEGGKELRLEVLCIWLGSEGERGFEECSDT